MPHLGLSRRAGQTIRIGDDIIITVHEIRGRTVRLDIEAPLDKKILRGELQSYTGTEGGNDGTAQPAA